MPANDVILKRFELPDEIRLFNNGRYDVITVDGITIGRATYEPGWKWSTDVGPTVDAERCTLPHVGIVLSGHAVVEFADGSLVDLTAGTMFQTPAEPHDSWVLGEEKYVSLHFGDAAEFAKPKKKATKKK